MNDAVDESDGRAGEQHNENADDAIIIGVRPVENQHRQHDRAQGEHPFHRKVDRAHQDDEGGANAQDKRDHRRLADPHEIAETS